MAAHASMPGSTNRVAVGYGSPMSVQGPTAFGHPVNQSVAVSNILKTLVDHGKQDEAARAAKKAAVDKGKGKGRRSARKRTDRIEEEAEDDDGANDEDELSRPAAEPQPQLERQQARRARQLKESERKADQTESAERMATKPQESKAGGRHQQPAGGESGRDSSGDSDGEDEGGEDQQRLQREAKERQREAEERQQRQAESRRQREAEERRQRESEERQRQEAEQEARQQLEEDSGIESEEDSGAVEPDTQEARQRRYEQEAAERQAQAMEDSIRQRAANNITQNQPGTHSAFAGSASDNTQLPKTSKRPPEELLEELFGSHKRQKVDETPRQPSGSNGAPATVQSNRTDHTDLSDKSYMQEERISKDTRFLISVSPTATSDMGDAPYSTHLPAMLGDKPVSVALSDPLSNRFEINPSPYPPRSGNAAMSTAELQEWRRSIGRDSPSPTGYVGHRGQSPNPFAGTGPTQQQKSVSDHEHTLHEDRSSSPVSALRPGSQAAPQSVSQTGKQAKPSQTLRPRANGAAPSSQSASQPPPQPVPQPAPQSRRRGASQNPRLKAPSPPPPPEDRRTPTGPHDTLRGAWNNLRKSRTLLWRLLRWFVYLVAALAVLQIWNRAGSAEWEEARIGRGVQWYGFSHMGRNIGQFVPNAIQQPLGFLTDEEYSALRNVVTEHGYRIKDLMDDNNDIHHTTKKLEEILPKVVSVRRDKKTSKLVIGQDFWHALKDRMHAETSILTLNENNDISNQHWMAMLKRLKSEGFQTEASWEKWLKNNRGKVQELLDGYPGQSSGSMDEKKMEKLIRDKLSDKGLRDIVVTRQEFIREVEKSLSAHKKEVDSELREVRDKLRATVVAAYKAAESSNAGGLSRDEVTTLVNDAVGKAISRARLQAGAKGNIISNLEDELSRRINYFTLGNGAIIDMSLTSPTWNPPRKSSEFGSLDWTNQLAPRFSNEHFSVLINWDDAGQCWCGGGREVDFYGETNHRSKKTIPTSRDNPVDIVIKLPETVIPEVLVVEHIDPDATLDPASMPKDIEVWVNVEEHSRRERVLDFMGVQFPGTDKNFNQPQLLRGFLQVGAFTYEHDRATNGVQVYRFSEELAKMDITTDQVLIRAATNHGANHTCFYRVRFYGTAKEELF
ncbi:hypothetical protein DL546_009607 [Coniochaeta pulveracea]|uniref:SUN domain-containing protein n=1 Tax=Coniochaeta pulveracea TaxID=177199 RepID=A0A420YM86_9PEZI|nr:hypothetical protein DL546_009607 [Coniochaeta pulveracea]